MKQILRYSLVALLAMFVGQVYAGSIVFADLNLENGVQYTEFDGGDFTVTFGGGGNNGKYYNTGSGIRVYGEGTMTIAAKSGTLTKLVITYDGANKPSDGTVVDGGTYDAETGEWTGSAASVVFTRPTGSGHWRVQKIEATVSGGTAVTVAAPTISGTTPFIGSTEVTITNNEEGAKIYYTTDGVEPTNNSLEYTAPLTITETTTVKAIAEKNGVSSSVASKTFTAVPSVANVAALNALENGNVFAFTGEALVVYVNGKYAYIKDETGSSLIYSGDAAKLANLAIGKKVAANWTGKVSIYKNLFEAVPDAVLAVTDAAAEEVTYPEAAITDVKAENMNQVVVLKDVTYTVPEEGSKEFRITKEGMDIVVPGYNQFGLEIAAPEEGKTYNITGVISVYNETVQFQPIAIQEGTPAPKDIELVLSEGCDISTALDAALAGANAKSITVSLSDATYTLSKSITTGVELSIIGNNATIDVSSLESPVITLAEPTSEEWTEIPAIFVSGIQVKGLKNALFYSGYKNYHIGKFYFLNNVVEAAADVTVFDFTKGSVAEFFGIDNSTFWAPTATSKSFYSSQGGQKATEYSSETIQIFMFFNNTFYNFAKGKNFFSHRQSNQKWLAYEVQNNIFVNCGKSGQVIKGMNGGQGGANPTWNIIGNAFNFDGADTSANEETGDADEPVKDSVAGVIAFTDAANGDFNGTFTLAEGATKPEALGDGRWTITYTTATGISTAKVVEQDGAAYNLAGQKVDKSFKGIVIVNGNKMIQK